MLLLPLSGCLGGGSAKGFDAVAAPKWSAGHSWTYRLSQSVSESVGRVQPTTEGQETSLVLTVINTTEPLEGEPAYYVSAEHEGGEYLDHPFFDGSLLAYAQSNLNVIARGHDSPLLAVPQSMPVDGSLSEPQSGDPCEGRPRIDKVDAEETLPAPAFPLASDGTERGTWGAVGDGFAFDYVLRVEGMKTVEVLAGDFEAVHVSLDMSPSAAVSEDTFTAFRVHADYWYSPLVENFVRIDLTASAAGGLGEERGTFRFESRAEVADFDLAIMDESPAPVLNAPHTQELGGLRIVSDVRLDQNVATEPLVARFALEATPGDAYYGGPIESVGTFGEPPYDPATHSVYWRVSGPTRFHGPVGYSVTTRQSETLQYTFHAAGHYSISAEVRPLVCGQPWLGSAYGTATPYWEKTWTVEIDPGPAHTIHLDDFHIEAYPSSTKLTWTKAGDATPLDGGHVRLTDPYQRTHRTSNGDANILRSLPGDWKIDWEAYGFETGFDGVATPVVGDDVRVTLRIDYDSPYGHVHF